MIQNYINHVVYCVDRSGSMRPLAAEVIKVLDSQVQHLAKRSRELNQETRTSIYLFSDRTECLVYDTDVLRLPSIAAHYKTDGQTALIDATLKAIEDLEKTSTLYGDHSFLFFTVSDGEENASRNSAQTLAAKIKGLPENWTVGILVPNQNASHEAKKFGFSSNNVQIWSTTNDGVREVGEVLQQTTDSFMRARATGVRGTKNLFSLDTSKISATVVKSNLSELSPSDYELLNVHKAAVIKPFVESWKIPFRLGSAYYQLSKPEKVQGHKQICVQNKLNGKVYGGSNARRLLGLPDYEVKVEPASHPDFDLFVQSTSTNRNLVGGTKLLVMK